MVERARLGVDPLKYIQMPVVVLFLCDARIDVDQYLFDEHVRSLQFLLLSRIVFCQFQLILDQNWVFGKSLYNEKRALRNAFALEQRISLLVLVPLGERSIAVLVVLKGVHSGLVVRTEFA